MKLYYMPGACSLATHILLQETGQKYQIEKVGRDKKTESGANYMEINPKGYVPAVEMDDGDILTENLAIHSYVADSFPAAKLAPAHGTKARVKLNELATYVSTEIHKGYSPLFSPTLPDEVKAGYKDRLIGRYDLIETLLSDGRTYLTGDTFTTVDSYLFTVSNWAPKLGIDLSKFARLQAYLQRIAARPAVKAAMVAEGLIAA